MKAVLSDLDGVLVDSHGSIRRAWQAWTTRHRLDFGAVWAVHPGRPSIDVVRQVAPHLDAVSEAEWIDLHQARDTLGVVALPGALELFERVERVAVVTSCTDPLARARLGAIGLAIPAVLVTSDLLSAGKPSPEGYLRGARELGADPAECVVLEDAPAGVAAGRAAGAYVVGIGTPDVLPDAHEHAPHIAAWLARAAR